MTYVDTKILIVTAIGSCLTIVLLFGKTVLSVEWWKKYIIFTNSQSIRRRQEQKEQKQKLEDANRTFTLNHHHHITQSKSQSLVHVEKLSKRNEDYDLINKKVFTCEMVAIGCVSTVENQFMTIDNGRSGQQQYVIPIYYVREHDNERVLIDTSVRYLDRYHSLSTHSLTNKNNNKYTARHQTHFLLCEACFWCATCLINNGGTTILKCPICNNAKVESLPVRYLDHYQINE